MNPFDEILVFSDKDVCAVADTGSGVPVQVLRPSLEEVGMPVGGKTISIASNISVIFVANFERAVNIEAATWLLEKVWGHALAYVPSLQLTLVGQGSDVFLTAFTERPTSVDIDSVSASGYVNDLSSYYRNASVAVAPLLRGAGVKFKTISAMLWGVPVVSTPIGAEGVGQMDHYLEVTADPEAFGSAIARGIRDIDHATRTAERALKHCREIYSDRAFELSIWQIYITRPR